MKRKKDSSATGIGKMADSTVAKIQGLRRSGAAGLHDSRPNRKRTRSNAKRSSIEESRGE